MKIINDIKNHTSHSVDFLLNNEIENSLSENGIKIRKVISPVLRKIYLTQTDYKLIREKDQEDIYTNKSKIFILNHRQADDIVLGANAVNDSGYIVFGNKYLALDTTNGLGLWAYGMILLDRDDNASRKSTYNKMKYVLENGGNIIIFPEGYWNLDDNGLSDERHKSDDHNSENWLIQDINVGVLRLAQETGCPIIPTIMHYDEEKEKKCFSKKGMQFYVKKGENIFQKKDQLVEYMTNIYYELMEKHSSYLRNDLERDEISLKDKWIMLKNELISACDIKKISYELDLANEKLIGKAKVVKDITTNHEAFKHLDNLNINKNNAFLLSKKLSGLNR